MPATEQLQWVVVDDFRAGIKGRVNPSDIGKTRQKMLGIAAPSGTYRCHALPDGSLGPLPARSYTLATALPVDSTLATGSRYSIAGFHVTGPIQTGVEFHIAYEGVTASSSRRFFYWQRIRNFSADQVDTLFSANPCTQTGVTNNFTSRPCWLHNWRANPTDPAFPGLPVVVAGWFEGGGGFQTLWKMFPDPGTSTSDTPGNLSTVLDPSHAFAHQGRAVVLDQNSYNHGANSFVWTHNEDLYCTGLNTETLATADTGGAAGFSEGAAITFGMENASGYMAAISTSHSELFMLKFSDGGLLVRGDLENATVLRLPGIPNAGLNRHHPALTPVGVVFMGDSGAYLWNGGESAEHISYEALNPDDLFPILQGGDLDFLDYIGRLYCWNDWVVFPKNWVWNWRDQSWWRIEDPSLVSLTHIGPAFASRLYAAPGIIANGGTQFHGFDFRDDASSYRWTSQPYPIGHDRELKLRRMVTVASGVGDVTITITARDGSTEVHTYSINSANTPVFIADDCDVDLQNLQFRIDVTTSGTTPVVHEVRFGLRGYISYPLRTQP